MKLQVRDPKTPSEARCADAGGVALLRRREAIWDAQTNPHSLYYDGQGRVMYHRAHPSGPNNPDFCKAGSDHPSAKVFPIATSGRQLEMYDPKTQKYTLINTCFPTHHVQFGFDKDNTAWVSAGGPASGVAGWVNMRVLEETGDEAEGARLDPVHPRHQRRRQARRVHRAEPAVRPEQGPPHQRGVLRRVAGSRRHGVGLLARLSGLHRPARSATKPDPSSTALAEVYEVPAPGYGPRGFDIDTKGVAWVPLSSGHMAAFDRTKCKVLNGPTIRDGKHCPEGWTLYPLPGPKLAGDPGTGSAEASYYTWVDQHDILGLGKDVPFATGNENESLIALKDGKMVNFVVPYPMGFYAKTFDGRIDDPNARLEGPWHLGLARATARRSMWKAGKGELPKLTKIQLRPDPLAH